MKQIFLIPVFLIVGACGRLGDNVEEQAPGEAAAVVVDEYEQPAPSTSYAQAHAAAVAAIETSASRGHAWTTADTLLEEAAAAAANGDDALAMQLADKARIHADLSILQADKEQIAWKDRVISD